MALWATPRLFQSGVQLGTTSRKKVITTDASNSGWGALYEGNPAYGSWLTHKRHLHINCIKMMAVCLVLKTVLPALKEHLVLVRSENTMVVAYINHQGGLRSCPFDRMTQCLLLWAQKELLSLQAVYVPDSLNQEADMLSRNNVALGEWNLQLQMVQMIWSFLGKTEVDLFASGDNCPCPTYFFKAARCSGPRLAQQPSICLPSDCPATPGYHANQGNKMLSPPRGPPLEGPSLVFRDDPAAVCSTGVNTTEESVTKSIIRKEEDEVGLTATGVYFLNRKVALPVLNITQLVSNINVGSAEHNSPPSPVSSLSLSPSFSFPCPFMHSLHATYWNKTQVFVICT